MTNTDPASTPTAAAPQLLDVVHVLEPHRQHTGVVIDILRYPLKTAGDRYRVRFRGGVTEWFWRDGLTVLPFTTERDTVLIDLAAIRTILHHAITVAEPHDVLHTELGELFDAVTAIAGAYLGRSLDSLLPAE